MNKKLLIVGSIIHEKIKTPYIKKPRLAIGGSAFYASLASSQFVKTAIVSAVGKDFRNLSIFEKQGIEISSVSVLDGKTLNWEAEYDKKGDIVSQKVDLGVYKEYRPEVSEINKNPEILFCESTNPDFCLSVINQISEPKLIALDSRDYYIINSFEFLEKLLKLTDILFLNEFEICLLLEKLKAGNNKTENLFIKFPNLKVVFRKKGANGVDMYTNKGEFCHIPAKNIKKIINPTGAGDVFAGTVLANIILNRCEIKLDQLIKSAKIGTQCAAKLLKKEKSKF